MIHAHVYEQGALILPPDPDNLIDVPRTDDSDEYQLMNGLCFFDCNRGYCPAGTCKLSSGGGDDDSDTVQVIVDSSIWEETIPSFVQLEIHVLLHS